MSTERAAGQLGSLHCPRGQAEVRMEKVSPGPVLAHTLPLGGGCEPREAAKEMWMGSVLSITEQFPTP